MKIKRGELVQITRNDTGFPSINKGDIFKVTNSFPMDNDILYNLKGITINKDAVIRKSRIDEYLNKYIPNPLFNKE